MINLDVLPFFETFINNKIINIICTETNCYAGDYIVIHRRAKPFSDLTPNELKVFLALVILQGIVWKPEMKQYWSNKLLLLTLFFFCNKC